jgi:hypothetical protein
MDTLFPSVEVAPQSNEIRALWWNQPYAGLMLHGKIETRTYPTKVRGNVLICVCKTPLTISQVSEIAGHDQYMRIVQSPLSGHVFHRENLGSAIAISVLVDCRPMTKEDEDKCYVRYREPWTEERVNKKTGKVKIIHKQLWCWVFEKVKPIQPFQIDGKQGWAILTDEEKNKIRVLHR